MYTSICCDDLMTKMQKTSTRLDKQYYLAMNQFINNFILTKRSNVVVNKIKNVISR